MVHVTETGGVTMTTPDRVRSRYSRGLPSRVHARLPFPMRGLESEFQLMSSERRPCDVSSRLNRGSWQTLLQSEPAGPATGSKALLLAGEGAAPSENASALGVPTLVTSPIAYTPGKRVLRFFGLTGIQPSSVRPLAATTAGTRCFGMPGFGLHKNTMSR